MHSVSFVKWVVHSTNGSSFIHSSVVSGRSLAPMSVLRSPWCPSEPALPHLSSLFRRQCHDWWQMEGIRCVFHWLFSLSALVWMLNLFNCSTIPNSPLWLRQWIHCQLQWFHGGPHTPVSSPSLKGSWDVQKAWGLPLSGWKTASCLHKQAWEALLQSHSFIAWATTNQHSNVQRPESPQSGGT